MREAGIFKLFQLVVCLGLTVIGSAQADVLVTRDGARIETDGPWEVKGRQIVFTLPNGTLSAVRASEIDLEASRAATDYVPPEPAPAAETVVKQRPEPVLVLTNKDIPQAATEDTDEGSDNSDGAKSPRDREPVQVVNWKRADGAGGLEIRGTLRNTGREIAANISLEVQVKNEKGEIAETASGFLQSRSLVSGQSTTFRVVLTEAVNFVGEPVFNVSSTGLRLGGASLPPGQRASEAGQDAGAAAGAGVSSSGTGAADGSRDGGRDASSGGVVEEEGAGSGSASRSDAPAFEDVDASEVDVDANG